MSPSVRKTASLPVIPKESYLCEPEIITLTHTNERGEKITRRYRLHLFARDETGTPIANNATQTTHIKATTLFTQYAQEAARHTPDVFKGRSIIHFTTPDTELAQKDLMEETRSTLHTILEGKEPTEASMSRIPKTMGTLWKTIFPRDAFTSPPSEPAPHKKPQITLRERTPSPSPDITEPVRAALESNKHLTDALNIVNTIASSHQNREEYLDALPPEVNTPFKQIAETTDLSPESLIAYVKTLPPAASPSTNLAPLWIIAERLRSQPRPSDRAREILSTDDQIHLARLTPTSQEYKGKLQIEIRGDGDCLLRSILVDLLLNEEYDKINDFLTTYHTQAKFGTVTQSANTDSNGNPYPAHQITGQDIDTLREQIQKVRDGEISLKQILEQENHKIDTLFCDITRDALADKLPEAKQLEARTRKAALGDDHFEPLADLLGISIHCDDEQIPTETGHGDHTVHLHYSNHHFNLLLP